MSSCYTLLEGQADKPPCTLQQYYSIDLDCPAGDTVRLDSFVNLPAVDTV
jgi:hypothetical protein